MFGFNEVSAICSDGIILIVFVMMRKRVLTRSTWTIQMINRQWRWWQVRTACCLSLECSIAVEADSRDAHGLMVKCLLFAEVKSLMLPTWTHQMLLKHIFVSHFTMHV